MRSDDCPEKKLYQKGHREDTMIMKKTEHREVIKGVS